MTKTGVNNKLLKQKNRGLLLKLIATGECSSRIELAQKTGLAKMMATDGPFLLEACVIEEGNVLPMTPPGGSVNQMLLEC